METEIQTAGKELFKFIWSKIPKKNRPLISFLFLIIVFSSTFIYKTIQSTILEKDYLIKVEFDELSEYDTAVVLNPIGAESKIIKKNEAYFPGIKFDEIKNQNIEVYIKRGGNLKQVTSVWIGESPMILFSLKGNINRRAQ